MIRKLAAGLTDAIVDVPDEEPEARVLSPL
jgi:hypothetical protein